MTSTTPTVAYLTMVLATKDLLLCRADLVREAGRTLGFRV